MRRPRSDDGGFVLPWFALMIVVLLGMAGFSIDVGNWYLTASRLQRAADAGALAGTVFLPSNPASATSTAVNAVNLNGYSTSAGDTINTDQTDLQPTQLRVTVGTTVNNSFASFLGIETTTIRRSAVGEFQGPIPMGSPDNRMGNDPDTAYNPGFWINIDGPNSNKQNGDRFATYNCNMSESRCSPGTGVGANNPATGADFSRNGYAFAIEVAAGSASANPLNIQVFDAALAYTGDNCGTGAGVVYPTAADITAMNTRDTGAAGQVVPSGYYDTASTRYSSASTSTYCVGDTTTNANAGGTAALSTTLGTTFIVREPDDTPFDDFDNDIATDILGHDCVMQTRTYDLRNASGATASRITQYLTQGDGAFADSEAVVSRSDDFTISSTSGGSTGVTFAESFRRWLSVCQISNPSEGDYILQIKTDTLLGTPNKDNLAAQDNTTLSGKNRMAIRAGFSTGTNQPSGSGFKLYGNGKLPIYANAPGSVSTFYVARVVPSGSNRTLSIPMFDMGDASSAGTLSLMYDADGDGTASSYTPTGGCNFVRDFGTTVNSATCTLTGVSSSAGYNGHIVQIDIPIPSTYTCDTDATKKGCWFLIRASFPGATSVQDTTTWQATIIGDPVHLIE